MFVRFAALAVTLSCGIVAFPQASAVARTTSLSAGSVSAGGSAYVTMALAAPANQCRLIAATSGRPPATISTLRPTEMNIAWVWQIPAHAASATWVLSAICGPSQIGVVLFVHGQRHKPVLALVQRIRVVQFGGTFPTQREFQLSLVPLVARTWWTLTAHTILSAFHTGRSSGQCTDYVAGLRPDIVEQVDISAYVRRQQLNGGALNVNWVAKDWAANAESAALPTGGFPAPGAVMVFQPGAYGAYSEGHVAIVDAVHSDGSFTISAMHAPVIGRVETRTFSARTARTIEADPRIRFIYK